MRRYLLGLGVGCAALALVLIVKWAWREEWPQGEDWGGWA